MRFPISASLCAVGALGVLSAASCRKAESVAAPAAAAPDGNPAPAAPSAAAAKTPAAAAVPDGVKKLLGKWVRADGGYVLELKNADLSGVIEAGYFNPKSIRVSRAIWMQGGAGLQVAVELNDVGYPGATYLLTYDAPNDKLTGQYTQPQMQQTFDIEFVRQAKP